MLDIYRNELERCLRCGICKGSCPLYRIEKNEGLTARGKIQVFKDLLTKKLVPGPRLQDILDLCLDCQSCEESCPVNLPMSDIIFAARSQYGKNKSVPLLTYLALSWSFKNPEIKNELLESIKLSPNIVLTQDLFLNSMQLEDLIIDIPTNTLRQQHRSFKKGKQKIAYFAGCLTNLLYPQVGLAAIKVLEELGFEVVIPSTFCCGYQHYRVGDKTTALHLAQHNINILSNMDADYIVTDCPTCASALKQYPKWLDNNEDSDLIHLNSKIKELTSFLINDTELLEAEFFKRESVQKTDITYHDSSRLKRSLKTSSEPRQLLQAIPGIILHEMTFPDRCCGGSVQTFLKDKQLVETIINDIVMDIKKTGASLISTCSPSCRLFLNYGIIKADLSLNLCHPIELIASLLD